MPWSFRREKQRFPTRFPTSAGEKLDSRRFGDLWFSGFRGDPKNPKNQDFSLTPK